MEQFYSALGELFWVGISFGLIIIGTIIWEKKHNNSWGKGNKK